MKTRNNILRHAPAPAAYEPAIEKKALLRHRHRQAVDRLRELIFLPDEEASPEVIEEMEALNHEVGPLTGRLLKME